MLHSNLFALFVLVQITRISATAIPTYTAPCTTPSQQEGACISSADCPVYDTASRQFHENVEYFRRVQCGYQNDSPDVCCPLEGRYKIISLPSPNQKRDRKKRDTASTPGPADLLPGKDKCGLDLTDDRIIGGEITSIDEFPWMALLFYHRKIQKHKFACGGALINNRYILTAAHCVTGMDYERLGGLDKVRLGEYNVDTDRDCIVVNGSEDCADDPVDVTAEAIIPHPMYDSYDKSQHHDIALIRLSRDVPYSDFIQPICIPDPVIFPQYNVQVGNKLFVAGWGRNESGMSSSVKMKVKIPIVQQGICQNTYQQFGVQVGDTQLCAGGESGRDSCNGDSGGPLMSMGLGNWIISGIVSVGPNKCGKSNVPGVYTKVDEYVPWIRENIAP